MKTYVSKCGGTQKSVTKRMDRNIAVRMSDKTFV